MVQNEPISKGASFNVVLHMSGMSMGMKIPMGMNLDDEVAESSGAALNNAIDQAGHSKNG